MSGSSLAAGGGSIQDGYRNELEGFAQTIRNGAPNLCDPQVGLDAAIACLAAREAMLKQTRIEINGGNLVAKA
jgi:hypothetical protein